MAPKENFSVKPPFEKRIKVGRVPISFDEEDMEGTVQPHDDALIVTAQISGFLVKNGDDRPRKRSQRNVPGPVRRARIKKSGLDEV